MVARPRPRREAGWAPVPRPWWARLVAGTLVAIALSGSTLVHEVPPTAVGPGTVEALTSAPVDLAAPASLKAPDVRSGTAASRAQEPREAPLIGVEYRDGDGRLVHCDGVVTDPGTNGRVPRSELCRLWQRPFEDRADAAVALVALNDAYRARFGEPMCLTSGYRSYEEQAALRRSKGAVAAPAGLSNHGWGLAVDMCRKTYTGVRASWLARNAARYDWENPQWARRGGGGFYEPWHWEYVPGVRALAAQGR